jgi:hypothetical protein
MAMAPSDGYWIAADARAAKEINQDIEIIIELDQFQTGRVLRELMRRHPRRGAMRAGHLRRGPALGT